MNPRPELWLSLVALFVVVDTAGARGVAESEDPEPAAEELADALSEVDAGDGIVTASDLTAETATDRPSGPAGAWSLAARLRPTGAARLEGRLEGASGLLTFAGRWRRDEGDIGGDTQSGWLQYAGAGGRLGVGTGDLSHGCGLLAAPAGRRSNVGVDASLTASRAGWRGRTSLGTAAMMTGAWFEWTPAALYITGGAGRDRNGDRHVLAAVGFDRGAWGLSGLGVNRGLWSGRSAAAAYRRGSWVGEAEVARWSRGGRERSWAGVASTRRVARWWRLELQAASANGAATPPGGSRPACLLGWRGRGWAGRLQMRRLGPVRVGLAGGWSEARDPGRPLADLRQRRRLEVVVSGRDPSLGRWLLRVRRTEDRAVVHEPAQPWLPPTVEASPPRTVLLLRNERPLARGRLTVSWRQQRTVAEARHLVDVVWRGDLNRIRVRAALQEAWGDPLDLVTLVVPVPGYYVVQHWGRWRSGCWLGIERRGRYRWQVGAVWRRGAVPDTSATRECWLSLRSRF